MSRITTWRNTYVVEALVALGLGGLLAYLLSGPLAGATAERPDASRAKQPVKPANGAAKALSTQAKAAPPAPLVAPPVTLPPSVASPRKSTQTVQKFK